jgi:hypothetical protein
MMPLPVRGLPRLLLILCLIGAGCAKNSLPEGSHDPETIVLKLSRGDFSVRIYQPKGVFAGAPKGAVIFGSGDGGWKIWEERACRSLALDGWHVIGWDCRKYAEDDLGPYDADVLGWDLQTMASLSGEASRAGTLIYGGYSTGAEQAVAGAVWALSHKGSGSSRCPQGLLLVAPGARGRYGITNSDLIGIMPRGAGSFSLVELAPQLGKLPVVQCHGTLDPLDSTAWLSSLRGPHLLSEIKGAGHVFGDADPHFQEILRNAARWLLEHSGGH